MKILVTGGLGVNGAWVVRELIEGGHDPVTLDNREDLSLVFDIAGKFSRHTADILDLDRLVTICKREKVDCIAHLAAIIGADADPYHGFGVNSHGTVTVLEAARRAEVPRVVFTSSKAVYGPIQGRYGYPDYEPLPEDHVRQSFTPMWVYSASKLLSEEAGRLYAARYGLEFASLRFATIFGPGKKARHGPIGVLSQIVENAMLGEGTRIPAGAEERDDMVYVKDVARGIVAAVTAPRFANWAYNIGSGRLTSLDQFAQSVKKRIADVEIEIGPGRNYLQLDDTYCLLDISRAKRELGYSPKFDLDDAIGDYAETMRQLGIAPELEASRSSWTRD